uniref:DNRLRE domain-containing protein n=1 Tax=Ignavibacterium album TaxID=591197 RepID=A0A832CZH2_9BACT
MHKIILTFIPAVFLFFLVSSCSDTPTDLGSDLLNPDLIGVVSFDSQKDSIYQTSYSFKKVIALGGASRVLIGKADNLTANALFVFTFIISDSLKQLVRSDSLAVLSAKVELTPDYFFGDSNATFDYSVHKINSSWVSSSFTADSFLSSQFSYDPSDLSSNKVESDSLYSFNLDANIVKDWLKYQVDTSLAKNNGILILPTATTNKIVGFVAFNPEISNDTKVKAVVQKLGTTRQDTLTAFVLSDVHIIIGENTVTPEKMIVQAGVVSNSYLYFDLSKIPDKAVINYAKLSVELDTLNSKFGSGFTNSLQAFLVTNSDSLKVDENTSESLFRNGKRYEGNLSAFLRYWLNQKDNQGIILRAGNQTSGVEKFILKGSNYPVYEERPKLEIVYTVRK